MAADSRPPGLQIGRIVHYVPPLGEISFKKPDKHLAAIVVHIADAQAGSVSLQLFFDGTNDTDNPNMRKWQQGVPYDPTGKQPHSWHYPERVE